MSELVKTQPFSSFKTLSQRFGNKNLHSPIRRWLLKSSLGAWERYYGVDKLASMIEHDFAAGQDGFAHDQWIFNSIFYPEISCTFLLGELPKATTAVQAAWLIHAALSFRERALSHNIDQEYEAGIPLDMSRYRLFFSRWTESSVVGGRALHRLTDSEPSDFIILAIDGAFHKLQVCADGQNIPLEQIIANIQELCDQPAGKSDFGVLTTLCDKQSAQLVARIDAQDLAAMNDALFLLAIDLKSAPETPDLMLRSVHADHFTNRDYRRAMQLVLSGNGVAGILVNPHAGLGGTLSARFCAELTKDCHNLSRRNQSPATTPSPLWQALPLSLPKNSRTDKVLNKIRSNVTSRLYPQGTKSTFVMQGVGADAFRAQGWSPDAAFHAALNLAFFRHFGRMPVVGNFINLRNIRHGDIWRYISTTPEMHEFVRAPSREALTVAMNRHRSLIKEQKTGQDEFYIATMFLKRLINNGHLRFSSFITLMMILQTLVPRFNRSIFSPDIWVSSIPTYPGIRLAGRASTTLSFLRRGCLGGHYMIFPDHIMTCLVDRPLKNKGPYDTGAFAREIERSIHEILRLP